MADAPFPPGDYPVVVVGSGPGALQVAYSLGRLGIGPSTPVVVYDAQGGMYAARHSAILAKSSPCMLTWLTHALVGSYMGPLWWMERRRP